MELQFLRPNDRRWNEFLSDVPHDSYHLPPYLDMIAAEENAAAEAVLISQGSDYFFVPYLVRSLAELEWNGDATSQLRDICSPYGYPGPLARDSSGAFFQQAIPQWLAELRQRGIVSGFIRLHPLLNVESPQFSAWGAIELRGRTVNIDLSLSAEEQWSATRRDHRSNINKSLRQGLTVDVVSPEEKIEEFIQVYYETMDRVGASDYYYFSPQYFQQLIQALSGHLDLCLVHDADGELLCAGLFTECAGIVQYHLSGTTSRGLKLRPSKLMLHKMRERAKARGNRAMHLGGGYGGREDSLFEFKAGFSKTWPKFASWHIVCAPDEYAALEVKRGIGVNVPRDSSFFPSYRQPVEWTQNHTAR